jgi:hypothetical protein
MSKEFISGVLIGTGTTALGFILTMAWDIWKTKREKRDLYDKLLNLLSDELEYNAKVVDSDKSLATQELSYLKQEASVVNALDTPRADFWEVFKQNYDHKFFSNEQIKVVKDIYSKIHSIIVNIESRENYRISNGAMSNFHTRMTKYNDILLNLFNEFTALYDSFRLIKK